MNIHVKQIKFCNTFILRVLLLALSFLGILSSSSLVAEKVKNVDRSASTTPKHILNFVEKHCYECHNSEYSEGDLNLELEPWILTETSSRNRWVLFHDRIEKGEMPPDSENLTTEERAEFLKVVSKTLHAADYTDVVKHGRATMRRLNREEFEANLRDLLKMPNLDIKDKLPADRQSHLFNKTSDSLDLSRIQLEAFLEASEAALQQAVASGISPRKSTTQHLPATRMFAAANTYGGREAMFYAKDSKWIKVNLGKIRSSKKHDPKVEMALFRSPSWPFYGYPDTFVAPQPGEYHLRFSARAVRQIKDYHLVPASTSQPMSFRARKRSGPDVSGDVRAIGGLIDIQPEIGIHEATIRLKKNETFEYNLLGLPVPRAINPPDGPLYYDFPPMPPEGHPGVAFQWLEVTGPIESETWPPASHKVLFDELPIEEVKEGRFKVKLVSENPEKEAIRLLRRFVKLACRAPIRVEEVRAYEELVLSELKQGSSLIEALLSGYNAFLCSSHFLYLSEPLQQTEKQIQTHYTVADRLSHFLWNSRPDQKLIFQADNQNLLKSETLRDETARLIESPRFEEFVNNFTDYWLSLKDIRRDETNPQLYPEYRFDDYLLESMESETRAYIAHLFRENMSVTALVDSDFALVNDRLSKHYGLPNLEGSALKRVELPMSSPYGGLLTQAAILKVTSNGTATSPVIRGAWIMERIMGEPPPPPPKNVPAVEPDIRGAKTIREQLAKHTSEASCANCHARFDPVGFALENFDVMGAWRTRYRNLNEGEKVTGIDRAGHSYTYHVAEKIDASGKLLDGSSFNGINELKTILIKQPRQLARNLLHLFTVYATGTPVRFSDRPVIEKILNDCQSEGYKTGDLLQRFIQSRIFLGTDIKASSMSTATKLKK